MTEDRLELTRRKILAGAGAVGLAGAGAGLGTSAFFSDRETFSNNRLVAGSLDVKAAYSAHYSDWSDDENDGLDGDVRMEADLTADGPRRGVPKIDDSSRVGLPANDAAMVSVRAGDAAQFLANTRTGRAGDASCPDGTDADDLDQPVVDLDDVKPGDFGEVTFSFTLCDNPGYVWMNGAPISAAENGHTEPEAKDADEGGESDESYDVGDGDTAGDILGSGIELLDEIRAAVWIDDGGDGPGGNEDGNNYQNGTETLLVRGSLRTVLAALDSGQGVALAGDVSASSGGGTGRNCFSAGGDGGTTHHVVFAWWVPVDHANEIQTDSVEFDLGFYAEQCRHNDGVGLSTGLAGYYPMETVEDGVAADVSGNRNDGTVVGEVTSVSGAVGKGGSFDGVDDYVEVPDDDSLDITGPYTEAAWVRPASTSGRNDVTMKDPGQWALGFQVRNGQLRAGFEDESDNNYIGVNGTVPAGSWTHLAVVYTGTRLKGFVDGSEVFDLASASDGSGIAVSDATPATNDEPLTIGKGEGHFDGAIDDLRIYDRALSDGEVRSLSTV